MDETARSAASDIRAGSRMERLAPRGMRPYLRLARIDRPIGTWLLVLPCWWSVALAMSAWPDARMFALFAVGALIMRGAGCTLNDIVDRDIDGRVARTAARPIPSGAVSVRQAIVFLGLQLLAGLAVLTQLNGFAIALGTGALPLIVVYPFMKRITYWPQLVLGLVFNWGALLGWAAVRGELGAPALALYGAGVLWTLGYDTIYAHQDKEYDSLIGLKSTALKLGDATRPWLFAFYGGVLVLLALAGHLAALAWPFFAVLALGAAHLIWQAAMVDTADAHDCLAKFKSNRNFGLIVLAGVVAGQVAG
ncbi:MAG: 4-hydroxybenzoate octaprenyltransferase [Rhodospirillales bacterium]